MPIISVLEEEFERLKQMEQAYIEKISSLPRGSITQKIIKGRPYYYLVYREGSRVVTKYLKLNEKELRELQSNLKQRQKLEKALREIRRDCRLLRKVVKR